MLGRSQNGHKIDQLFPLPKMFTRCAPFPGGNVNAPSPGTEPLKGGHTLGTFFVNKYDTSQVEKFD